MDLKRYSLEIQDILEKLDNLKQGNYYEKLKKPGTPSAMTIADRLHTDIINLLKNIKDDLPGAQEKINEAVRNFKI